MTHDELMKAINVLEKTMSDFLTPYGLSKVLNTTFDINLPPQMMYNYVRNGLIDVVDRDGKKVIDKATALKFVERYGLRNIITK